ncbi:MAG: tripartite tricarboxylate transporter substrate binding protein [Clostridiales bacterium]|nr:tripartite tricarboxylate transporter substrate binding protein [Clostridiales bacterium]
MKKLLALLMCVAITLSFAACANSTTPAATAADTQPATTDAATTTTEEAATEEVEWPTQAITVLEPYAAGSTSDLCQRLICSMMEKDLGVPMVVKNVVGADGATCYTELKNSKPDGYTLGHVQHSGLCIGVFLNDLSYSAEDFYYFGSTSPFDHCVSVAASSDIYTLDDLMAWAADQDQVVVAYSGYVNVFNAMNLFRVKGLEDKIVCIAYDDNPAQAVVSGDCDVCVWQKAGTRSTAESGNLRIIAALATERWADIPDVPTAREQGYDVLSIGHAYFAAPIDTPDYIKEKLQASFDKCIASPEYQEQMAAMGWTNYYLNHDEATAYIYEQREVAKEYLTELGLINN